MIFRVSSGRSPLILRCTTLLWDCAYQLQFRWRNSLFVCLVFPMEDRGRGNPMWGITSGLPVGSHANGVFDSEIKCTYVYRGLPTFGYRDRSGCREFRHTGVIWRGGVLRNMLQCLMGSVMTVPYFPLCYVMWLPLFR